MSRTRFLARARIDPEFRRAQLAELRWQKQIAMGLAIVVVAAWGSYALYGALREGRWVDVDPSFALLVAVVFYARADSRQTRLVAMNSESPK